MEEEADRPEIQGKIKVVGPCKSGKSTLVAALRARGYDAHSCSQEHSEVPTMWQRVSPGVLLIYLDVTLEAMQARGPRSDWPTILPKQQRRLTHARQHANVYVQTAGLDPEQTLDQVLAALARKLPNGLVARAPARGSTAQGGGPA
jgi:hypothetical protein